ncbi:hypothetical protein MTR_7g104745 [Medicago truncatula]|uniref:Uncharacterized protein n=1 Tax=Medicago truncatula TaxID=3880 RepID=A0A072U354_MEDTR|nr:hypothetical protein MTR_7g104745 [Medicago truncatula]
MSEKEEREGVRREGKGPSGAKRDTDLERRDRVVPPSTSGGRHIDKKVDLEALEAELQDVWWGDKKLKVNIARFGRVEVSEEGRGRKEQQGNARPYVEKRKVEEGLSFKEALQRNYNVIQDSVKEGVKPVLELLSSEEVLEDLKRTFVGVLKLFMDVKSLQTRLFMEGWRGISVASIGDKRFLLRGEAPGIVLDAMKEKKLWWDSTFANIRPWAPQLVSDSRKVWIQVWMVEMDLPVEYEEVDGGFRSTEEEEGDKRGAEGRMEHLFLEEQAQDNLLVNKILIGQDLVQIEVDLAEREKSSSTSEARDLQAPVNLVVGPVLLVDPPRVPLEVEKVGHNLCLAGLGSEVGLDSEEIILDSSLLEGVVNKRRLYKKSIKKKLPFDYGTPKCFQFVEALKHKGKLQGGECKEGSSMPSSGLRLIVEEFGTWVPESPVVGDGPSKNVLDASRIYSLQKKDGFSFNVVDQDIVTRLAELEVLEVAKDEVTGRANGTKLEVVSNEVCLNIWGGDDCDWSYLPSVGNSGSILSIWRKSKSTILFSCMGEGFVCDCLEWGALKKRCFVVNVYFKCDLAGKRRLWENLALLRNTFGDGVWCCIGDFNFMRYADERRGTNEEVLSWRVSEMDFFKSFIVELLGNHLIMLNQIQREFLWGGVGGGRKVCWVKWNKVCHPRNKGGLGVQNVKLVNLSLLAKWKWRLLQEDQPLWKRVLEDKYGDQSSLASRGMKFIARLASKSPPPRELHLVARYSEQITRHILESTQFLFAKASSLFPELAIASRVPRLASCTVPVSLV